MLKATIPHGVLAGEIYEVTITEKLLIQMFRSGKYAGDRDGLTGFRPAKVLLDGAEVWSFQTANFPKGQFAELREYDDHLAIIAIMDKSTLFSVICVNDLANPQVKMAGKIVRIGATQTDKLLEIKFGMADEFGVVYVPTYEEKALIQAKTDKARKASQEALKALEAEKEAKRLHKEKERNIFIAGIMARKPVEAHAKDGRKLHGIPVSIPAEWLCLLEGTFCMFMQNDKPVEAFIATRKTKSGKLNETAVMTEISQQNASRNVSAEIPEAVDQRTITIGGEARNILIFEDQAVLKQLQAAGLNSGTWVGIMPAGSDLLTVSAIYSDDIRTLKQFKKQPMAIMPTVNT